jgi:tetratricopeptide (TPR) repeat protein
VTRPARLFLVALHFVCPLLFFTDLTRNPYFTQIALLNAGLLAALALETVLQSRSGQFRIPRTPLDAPWVVFLAISALSWVYAYFAHPEFFRESMRAEGTRNGMFLLVNAALPFALAAGWAQDSPGKEEDASVFQWLIFAAVWMGLWSFYPQMRGAPKPASPAVLDHIFDPYGAFVWTAGLVWVLRLARGGGQSALRHAALTVGTVAGIYGIGQYFALEFFWPKILNPYGGRSVSTFGNPNFMSSYMVMLLPLVVVHYLEARTRAQRAAYAFMFVVFEGTLLCSLTRSSWIGAVAALAPLALSRRLRGLARDDLEFHGLVASAVVAIAVLWPQSNVAGYAPTVVGRLAEMGEVFSSTAATQSTPYSPLYQRFLIWLCAWTMGAENPLLGKGWGHLELFYPFYQGHFIDHFAVFRTLRTHANNAHNEILEIFAQTGIAGLGAYLWMWVVFYAGIVRVLLRSERPPRERAEEKPRKSKGKGKEKELASLPAQPVWLFASAASALGMLADNMLNVSMHFAVPGFFFWWQVGTAAGDLGRGGPGPRKWTVPAKPFAFAAAAVVCGLCVWGSSYWVRHWNREVQYFMGFKLMRQNDPERALRHLEAAYRWHPREVNTNYEMGNAYARSDRHEKAIWAYAEALNANAGYDEIYFNRGTILSLKLGRREEAIREFQTSWGINPLSRQTYMNFVALLLSEDGPQKHGELAVQVLSRAAHYFPDNDNFLLNLGSLQSIKGKPAEAIDAYSRLLRRRPELAAAENSLRAVAQQAGLARPPILEHVAEFRELSARLQRRQYDTESLAMARRALERFPASLQVKFYLGNLEMMGGDANRAETLLREVNAAQPGTIPVLLNLGQVLRRNGKVGEARAIFSAILKTDPNNQFAKQQLAQMGG